MHAIDNDLSVLNTDKRLFDAAFSHTQGFDFCAVKCNSASYFSSKNNHVWLFIVRDQT